MSSTKWEILFLILAAPLFAMKPFAMVCYFVLITLMMLWLSRQEECFTTIMDYFPWNEVNVVRKRNKESTVVQCDVSNVMDVRPEYDYLWKYDV